MVVVTDAASVGEYKFERRRFGTTPGELRALAGWLAERGVQEAVMESTAQYWKPVWQALEQQCKLNLAQAHSNRAPRGRKSDFADAERLLRRLIAGELILSFVPDEEQRLWRTMTRTKHQLTRDKVRLQGQLECLLEEARIKLSSLVSDMLGASGRRILEALAKGETDPARLAALADYRLHATQEELQDALGASATLSHLHRRILSLFLDRLGLLESQMEILEQSIATSLKKHEAAVLRVAEVPGFGVESAHQAIAEVGVEAAAFSSPAQMASWVGVCPGREESAEASRSNRSPKGNRTMRRLLNQAANAAVKTQGSIFQGLYRRLVARMGHNKAIWAIAHRLCRLIWKILHQGVRYQEPGIRINPRAARNRANKLIAEFRKLGYQVQLTPLKPQASA